jgi:hypothetical protein
MPPLVTRRWGQQALDPQGSNPVGVDVSHGETRIETVTRTALPPILIVVAGLLGLDVAYGVDPGDALLYLGYELLFVFVPGLLVYRALSASHGSGLRQLAVGWALGYVLEVLAFMITAATGNRTLFLLYPFVVGGAAYAVSTRFRSPELAPQLEPRLTPRLRWLLAVVCLAAMGYFAVAYFPTTPLPGTKAVSYYPDHSWMISIAADAKHHWPIQDPNVSGEPLPYHYFVNVHLAAASQVTGIILPVVYFRLFVLPLAVVLTLQLAVAGRSFAGSIAVGLLAASLVFFVGELQMDLRQNVVHAPFTGFFFGSLLVSPIFLFGLVFLVPLITLLGEQFATRHASLQRGNWLLIALFMVGASDAKIVILPVVLFALLLYAVWSLLTERQVPSAVWVAAAAASLVAGVVYVLQYRGHSSGTRFDLRAGFNYVVKMPAVSSIKHVLAGALPSFPGRSVVLSTGAVAFGLAGLLGAQFIGLLWIIRRYGYRWDRGSAWLGSLVLTGLVGFAVISDPSAGSLYVLYYGVFAGCILSAWGLWIGWTSRPQLARGGANRVAITWLAWLVLIFALLAIPLRVHVFSGSNAEGDTYALWYGGLLLTLGLLYVVARRAAGGRRWAAVAAVCAAVLVVGLLDSPAIYLRRGLTNASAPLSPGRGLTPPLYEALSWVRDHTPTSSVIAVNTRSPIAFDYAAFSERRVFLGGWAYSQRSREAGYVKVAAGVLNPFAGRLALNEAAFASGNAAALGEMVRRHNVRYLVIDQFNGAPANVRALLTFARTVYRRPGASVLEIRAASLG